MTLWTTTEGREKSRKRYRVKSRATKWQENKRCDFGENEKEVITEL